MELNESFKSTRVYFLSAYNSESLENRINRFLSEHPKYTLKQIQYNTTFSHWHKDSDGNGCLYTALLIYTE